MSPRLVLTINPGSTSDEVALFRGEEKVFHKVVRYTTQDLAPFDGQKVTAQYDFRKRLVLKTLEEYNFTTQQLDAVVGRGGLVKPIPSGTYKLGDSLLRDLREGVLGDHPSNLGGLIAHAVAGEAGKPSFIVDPVVVDELDPIARYSGMPENPRVSIFHCLNQKRVARMAAAKLGKKYDECNFIVLHGGGGMSCGIHVKGRVLDVNNALDGDGAFTPQRAGTLPAGGLVRMCFSGKYTHEEMKLKLKGKGGLVAHTGTTDGVILERLADGEILSDAEKAQIFPGITQEKSRELLQAMAYQMAKEVCALGAMVSGKVDAIIFTGGLAYSKRHLVPWLRERTEWIAPFIVIPGGDEMAALRDAALRVLAGEEVAKDYPF